MRQSTAGSLGFSFDRPLHIRPDPQSIADAYVYLLGRMLVIRQEHIDLDQVGADYNVLTYDPPRQRGSRQPELRRRLRREVARGG